MSIPFTRSFLYSIAPREIKLPIAGKKQSCGVSTEERHCQKSNGENKAEHCLGGDRRTTIMEKR